MLNGISQNQFTIIFLIKKEKENEELSFNSIK